VSCAVFNILVSLSLEFCSRSEVFLRNSAEGLLDVFSRVGISTGVVLGGEGVTPHMTRGICRFLLRSGFSRVELGVRPYVNASACRRLGDH
jgi:hypothetical protein